MATDTNTNTSPLVGTDTLAFAREAVRIMGKYFVVSAHNENLYRVIDHERRITVLEGSFNRNTTTLAEWLRKDLVEVGVAPHAKLISKMLDYYLHNTGRVELMDTDEAEARGLPPLPQYQRYFIPVVLKGLDPEAEGHV